MDQTAAPSGPGGEVGLMRANFTLKGPEWSAQGHTASEWHGGDSTPD